MGARLLTTEEGTSEYGNEEKLERTQGRATEIGGIGSVQVARNVRESVQCVHGVVWYQRAYMCVYADLHTHIVSTCICFKVLSKKIYR